MASTEKLTRRGAIEYLGIPEKYFENYFRNSQEIKGTKEKGRFIFKKEDLDDWKKLRDDRTVLLNLKEYEQCFEFAIKMAYSTRASRGTGIRGVRSEVQMADDFILGILAEFGVKNFLKNKYNKEILLDMNVHPGSITAQDFDGIMEGETKRKCKIGVAVKSSKIKSCFNVIDPLEYENDERKSDVYIFARVGLPSDHLFRILREHSFFKNVREYLQSNPDFRKIDELKEIPIWICGYNYHEEFRRETKIPGQEFEGYRYVVSTAEMLNKDEDWEELIKEL